MRARGVDSLLLALLAVACRARAADATDSPLDRAPARASVAKDAPDASSAPEPLTNGALALALGAAPADVVSAVQPFGARRYVAVIVRGEGPSPSLHAVVASNDGGRVTVEDDLELPTSGLWARAESPRGIDALEATVRDFDRDGALDLAIVVRYPTEPVCAPDLVASVEVEQLFVVVSDPRARVAASVQTAYAPSAAALGSRRAKVAWDARDGGAMDLVVAGEECDTRGADGGPRCAAFRESYRFSAAARSWLKGEPPRRAPAAHPPCPR